MVWGLAVTLSVFLTRNICYAHLNPAVSVGMVVAGRMSARKLPVYLSAQFVGAVLAGVTIYGLFSASIAHYEAIHEIVRGTSASVDTARIFGEFVGRPSSDMQPLFIGLTVSSIIFFVAPITQCGLNPARDFGPRLVAYFAGWGDAALPDTVGGWFWVYILAPIIGASIAAVFFKYILEPINEKKNLS